MIHLYIYIYFKSTISILGVLLHNRTVDIESVKMTFLLEILEFCAIISNDIHSFDSLLVVGL